MVDLVAEAWAAHNVLLPFVAGGMDNQVLTARFRPRPEDYALVFRGDIASGMRSIYDGIWETRPSITRKSHQSVILAHAALAEGLLPGNPMMEHFPGGYAGLADHLVAGRVWVCWKFVAPGERLGMAWDGLVHLDERWVWFPRPWAFLQKLTTA